MFQRDVPSGGFMKNELGEVACLFAVIKSTFLNPSWV
jgi:hypothetical protein